MDSKIIIIIALLVALSVLGTVIIMNFMFGDAIQLEKEHNALEERLRDYERSYGATCEMYEEGVVYNGMSWCESNFEDYSKIKQDCAVAQTPGYSAWCEYHGLR